MTWHDMTPLTNKFRCKCRILLCLFIWRPIKVWPFLIEINLMTTFHVIASEKAVASKADEFLLFLLQISEDMYVDGCSFLHLFMVRYSLNMKGNLQQVFWKIYPFRTLSILARCPLIWKIFNSFALCVGFNDCGYLRNKSKKWDHFLKTRMMIAWKYFPMNWIGWDWNPEM